MSTAPTLNDFTGILFRFRMNKYALATILRNLYVDLYVDNVISSFQQEEELIQFYSESRELILPIGPGVQTVKGLEYRQSASRY
jgi:hypothetical protein